MANGTNGLNYKWLAGVSLAALAFFLVMWIQSVSHHVSEIPVSRIQALEENYKEINRKLDKIIAEQNVPQAKPGG